MEINEVKIGDTVSFDHKGKKMMGKVLYRHADKDKAALMGHVNVQISGDKSYPVTVHISKLKPVPALKEETFMNNLNEKVLELIQHIQDNNNIDAENVFNGLLQDKIDELLNVAKVEVAQSMFNTEECAECMEEEKKMKKEKDEEDEEDEEEIDEALKGKQHKIDANKNGKIDAQDFKLLRAKKGMKEDVEQVDELSKQALSTYIKKAGPQIAGLEQKHGITSKPAMKRRRGVTRASINYLKKDLGMPTTRKEEVEQVDEDTFEQGGKTKMDFKTPRHVSPHFKNLKKLSPAEAKADMLKRAGLKDVSKNPPAVKKEDVAHEAYSDPYAAKKSAEMKKAHAATMADAKKEYDAAKKSKFAKNFMKMKKEEAEQIDEVSSETLKSYQKKSMEQGDKVMKKQMPALSAKKFANRVKGNARASEILNKREPAKTNSFNFKDMNSERAAKFKAKQWDESVKIDEVITKKTPTGEVISDFVNSKNPKFAGKSKKERIRMALGAKYAMMKNEESELQELDKSTMISYLQKRHFQGKKTTPKQQKGRMNALDAIDTKNQGKKRSDKEKAASSMSGAQADYKKGTYSGD